MRNLRRREKHRRSIWTGRCARAAADAGRRFHCQIGIMLGDWDRVRFGSRACACGNESTSLYDTIQRAAIDYQIFHKRKRSYPKWLDCDRSALAKLSHVKLAYCARMIGAMRFTVNRERASATNAFAAIRVERDWFFPTFHQHLVENVEHFEKGCVRRNVA